MNPIIIMHTNSNVVRTLRTPMHGNIRIQFMN